MEYINNEDVLTLSSINDWNVEEDMMSGTIAWYKNVDDTTLVLATPHWEYDGKVPIDVTDDDGGYYEKTEIVLSGTKSEQLKQYKEAVESVIKTI
tara:strand:+ start:369 stop:653 length:285 start_codon:yes stop_codon:yes gene_type:complete